MKASFLPRSLTALGLALAAVAALAEYAFAQWAPGGRPVAPGVDGGQTIAIPAGDGQSGLYVAWRDERSGNSDVYIQRLTAEGFFAPGWLPSGLLVANGPTSQTALVATPDEAGGVIVSWVDAVFGGYDLRAQRIRPDGTISQGWPNGGIVVAAGDGTQEPEAMMSDGQGGAFLAWTDNMGVSMGPTLALLQHFGPTGVPAPGWPASGQSVVTTPRSHGATRIVSDGAGGVLAITAELGRALPGTPEGRGTNHSAVRFLSTGELAPGWPAEGVLLLRTLSAVEVRKICPDGAGGAYFAWNDNRFSPEPVNPFYYDIYAQHVLADGSIDPLWPPDGLPVADGPAGQYDFDLAADGDGGAFLAWQEFRSDVGWRIYAQRIRPDGTPAPGWAPEGNRVTTNEEYEVFPRVIFDDMDGFWTIWEVQQGGLPAQRYLHMGGGGQVAPGWSSDGELLASPAFYPVAISDNAHGMLVAFERPGEDGARRVWAQRIYGDDVTSTLPSLVHAEATASQATLRWSVADIAVGSVRVERRTDTDAWFVIGTPQMLTPGLLEYVDRDLVAGRYAYRLVYSEGGSEHCSAETWLEVEGSANLALAGFRPNPAIGAAVLAFSLPDDQPARLDVIDVRGRVVQSRDVGVLGGGSHVLSLAGDVPLGAGMYWLRLTHPDRTLTTKGIVVR